MSASPRVHVIATQHLDVAWLWPRVPYGEELMRQVFERAIDLIEADPDGRFVFSRSTVWSYWIIEQRHPDLFEKIKAYVAQGRIELCGGEWVEPDHVIPGGESLVRQCALGQWYFLEAFGWTASVCWDPDIFGHPHSLPQILKKCGLDGFYAHRCRPHDEAGHPLYQFLWEGPDGSQVFYLAGTWLRAPNTQAVSEAVASQRHQGLPAIHVATGLASDRRITMQENWLPMPAKAGSELGLPRCAWSTAHEALADMRTYADRLPVVRGELGFQFSGTYTSNGFNKRANRWSETLLVQAEKAAAWATEYGFRYPQAQLTQAWRDHCINQFHDIICGCSVAEVHEEDRALWQEVLRRATYARDEALAYLADRVFATLSRDTASPAERLAVFNFLSWPRGGVVEVPLAEAEDLEATLLEGSPLVVQRAGPVDDPKALIHVPEVPGIGFSLVRLRRRQTDPLAPPDPVGEEVVLENDWVRVVVDPATGEVTGLLDKRSGFEAVRPGGRANRWVFLEDADPGMPAWTIRYTGRAFDNGDVESTTWVTRGPLRQTVRTRRTVSLDPEMPPTTIIQEISIDAGSPVVTFATHGVWYARNAMAKAVFDLAVEARTVTAETPYAAIERVPGEGTAAHRPDVDTLAEDQAGPFGRVVAEPDCYMQRWLDVSDGSRGVLFVNDGLYGYDIVDQQVRLSLLRAPLDPGDKVGDTLAPRSQEITGLGPFAFSYGVMPHAGGWQDAGAPRRARAFNEPLVVRPVRDGLEPRGVWRDWWDTRSEYASEVEPTFVELVQGAGACLTVVKRAEDGEGLVLRVVETLGQADAVVLRCHRPVLSAKEVDMLERTYVGHTGMPLVKVHGAEIALDLSPWEIKTLRVRLHR